MSILINGGAGFIGSYVTQMLLKRGEKIVIQDLNLDTAPLRLLLSQEEVSHLTLVRGDVSDPVSYFRIVREHQVDSIIHVVQYSHTRSDADPWGAVRINVNGTMATFEAARIFGIRRVVWASSIQVFGRHTPYSKEFGPGPLVDGGSQRPWSAYSACKALCEYMAGHYHRKWGLDLRGLRPCGTFGPGRQNVGLTTYISDMIRAAALGQPYTIPNGDEALPHAYVEDVARAFVLALYYEGAEMSGRTLNIGGLQTTHRELADIVRRVVPGADISVAPGDGGEPITLPIDNSTLSRLTGFRLEVSLEEGIRRMVEFFRQQDRG